jgi:hypothetical protein
MIFDAENLFSDGQSVTATAVSDNIVDTGADHDWGVGDHLHLVVTVPEAVLGGTSITVELQTADTDDAATWETIYSSDALPVVDLGEGSRPVAVAVPRGAKRYLRLNYVAVGVFTGGAFDAALVSDVQDNRSYPIGSTISG